MQQGVRIDGEYYLKVKSRILQVRLCLAHIIIQGRAPNSFSFLVSMCLCADLLRRDADRFPKGVRDPAQRSDRQLL